MSVKLNLTVRGNQRLGWTSLRWLYIIKMDLEDSECVCVCVGGGGLVQ
jgi:hypothetical protein